MTDDRNLIAACIKHDKQAESELYKMYFKMLMAICMRYATDENDAVSLLNQGFIKILNGLKKRKDTPLEPMLISLSSRAPID